MFQPIEQTGHNCKIVAIANIEKYFTERSGKTFPLHKQKKHFFSIRELAKRHGSLQGELLEAKQVSDILHDLGYEARPISIEHAINYLALGYLIFSCFAVERHTGNPSQQYDGLNEHAAVIYRIEQEKLAMMHWGRCFSTTIEAFRTANLLLPFQRLPEIYKPVADKTQKYDLCAAHELGARKTIEPKQYSGFHGVYFAVKPKNERFVEARQQTLLNKLYRLLCQQNHAEFRQLALAVETGQDLQQAITIFEQDYAAHRLYYQCWWLFKVALGLLSIALILPWLVIKVLHGDMQALFFQDHVQTCYQATQSFKTLFG